MSKRENQITVWYAENSSIKAETPPLKADVLADILYSPEQNGVFFLDEKLLEELEGTDSNDLPFKAEKAIDQLAGETNNSEDGIKKFNKLLFGKEPEAELPLIEDYEKSFNYIECISLKDQKSFHVSKEFLEPLMEKNNKGKEPKTYSFLEHVINSIDNTLSEKDEAEGKRESKGSKHKKVEKEIDKEIRSKYLEKWHARAARKEKIAEDKAPKEEDGSIKEAAKKEVLKYAGKLVGKLVFPPAFEKFVEGTELDLIGKWEKEYVAAEGEKEWSKEKQKQSIIENLDKKDFNQDDADKALRAIRDLWGSEDEDSVHAEFYQSIKNKSEYTAKQIYSSVDNRKALKNKIEEQDSPPAVWEASVSGSVMKLAVGASGEFKSDISSGKLIKAEGEAHAEALLAEGKASFSRYIPDENGFHAYINISKRHEEVKWKKYKSFNEQPHLVPSFSFDSSFIEVHTGCALINHVEIIASTGQVVGLDIIGNTDAVGSAGYNMELGKERAEAAYAFLKGDFAGMRHMFQKGIWNKTHIEYMQSIINFAHDGFPLIKTADEIEFNRGTLLAVLKNPETLLSEEKISFDNFHALLENNYPQYKEYAKKTIKATNNTDIALSTNSYTEDDDKQNIVNTYSNKYIKELLFEYRNIIVEYNTNITGGNANSIWQQLVGGKLDNVIRYKHGVKSMGETNMLIDTKKRNALNRRVDLIAYVHNTVIVEEKGFEIDFGYYRMCVEGIASGYAGASVAIAGSANLSFDSENMFIKGATTENLKSENKPKTKENSSEKDEDIFKDQAINANTELEAKAFAGVQAEAGLKGMLDWCGTGKASDYLELASVGFTVSGTAGAGAEAEFKIGYDTDSGRFLIRAKATATLGLGGGGSLEYAVGLGGLWEMIKYIYNKLQENDFNFIDIFDPGIYEIFNSWNLRLLQNGLNIAEDASNAIDGLAGEITQKALEVLNDYDGLIENWNAAELEMQAIEEEKEDLENLLQSIGVDNSDTSDKEMINYLTPEIKGRILYLLCQYRTSSLWSDFWTSDLNHGSETAALKIIQSIKHKREWQETFEHMGFFIGEHDYAPVLKKNLKPPSNPIEDMSDKQKRVEKNILYLKNNLLFDLDKWEIVQSKIDELQ